MFDLPEIKKKHDSILEELAKPEAFLNMKEYQNLRKESQKLKKILDLADEIETANRQIAENKELIASETDPEFVQAAESDISVLEAKRTEAETKLDELEHGKAEEIDHIIVEIRAGAGGDEAALFAGDLFRMYSRYAQEKGWQTAVIDSSETTIGGYKEIVLEIQGREDVYGRLKYESGVHRVQRVPETEKSGRVHTSTATVAILPVKEAADTTMNPSDLKIEFFRSSGPGGQNVNKVETAVRIIHIPTGFVVACQSGRSQASNKEKALQILQSKLSEMQKEKEMKEAGEMRKSQIGTADRSEKIRTYNFPQDRITDHRVKQSWHNIEKIMEGYMDPMIEDLKKELK